MAAIEPLYKVPEAAKVVRVSNAMLYKLIAQGVIRTIKIGRSTRIEPEELRTFIRAQAEATQRQNTP